MKRKFSFHTSSQVGVVGWQIGRLQPGPWMVAKGTIHGPSCHQQKAARGPVGCRLALLYPPFRAIPTALSVPRAFDDLLELIFVLFLLP